MKSEKEIREMIEELEKAQILNLTGSALLMIHVLKWVLEDDDINYKTQNIGDLL